MGCRYVERAAVFVMFMVACMFVGCVIPPNLRVEVNETEYKATCHCEVCTEIDPTTLMCTMTVAMDRDFFECSDPSNQVDEDALAADFLRRCVEFENANTQCGLAFLDEVRNPFVTFAQFDEHGAGIEKNCSTTNSEPLERVETGVGPQFWSHARVMAGSITMSSPDGNGTTPVTGRVDFIGGNCTTGTCPFRVATVELFGGNFSFAGETVRRPYLINTTVGEGTYLADAHLFIIPPGGISILATGDVSGPRGLHATSDATGVGLINQTTRQLVFSQSFKAGDIDVSITMSGTIDNLLPIVTLPPSITLECAAAGGSMLSLPATIIDADGQHQTSRWYVDDQLVATNTPVLNTFVSSGSHAVRVEVFDEQGGQASASTTVTVVDTTPPTVVFADFCLWPPNHKRYVVDASMIDVVDACDPNASLTFVSGSSDQPGNGTGDGNTVGDVVVHADSVCATAERDGMVLAGRRYSITARVSDAAQNASEQIFDIVVPHNANTCGDSGGLPVDGDDPRCVPLLTPPVSPVSPDHVQDDGTSIEPSRPESGGGCATSRGTEGAGTFALGMLVLALGLRRRGAS